MAEAPALEMILQIDELLGQFVEVPIGWRIAVDLGPCRLDRGRMLPRPGPVALEHAVGNGEPAPRQQRDRFGIDRFAGEFRFQPLGHVGRRLVHGDHVRIASAKQEFHHPVLRALEPARSAQVWPDGRIIMRGHRAEHIPALDQLSLRTRHAREHLEGGPQVVSPDACARLGQLVQAQLEPQLARLVDDDEQHLVMRFRRGMLRRENALEIEVAGIGNIGCHARCPSAHRSPMKLPLDHLRVRMVLVEVAFDDAQVLGVRAVDHVESITDDRHGADRAVDADIADHAPQLPPR